MNDLTFACLATDNDWANWKDENLDFNFMLEEWESDFILILVQANWNENTN